MRNPCRIRVSERRFLNLPGHHGGAYVLTYVEDTAAHADSAPVELCATSRIDFEISDGSSRVTLRFAIATAGDRLDTFHKVDTLLDVLGRFRDGLAAEAELHAERRARVDGRACGVREHRPRAGPCPDGHQRLRARVRDIPHEMRMMPHHAAAPAAASDIERHREEHVMPRR